MKLLSTIALCSSVIACGGEEVDTSIVDNNQIISRENGTQNAKAYARQTFGEVDSITAMSDSTITPNCRYGDGWISATITDEKGDQHKIKCQTNGQGKGVAGCLDIESFNKKYVDGKCDKTIKKLERFN